MIRLRENKLSIQVGQKQELKIARPRAQKSKKHGFEGSESSEQTSNEFSPKLKLRNVSKYLGNYIQNELLIMRGKSG